MIREEIIAFLNSNPACYLATLEENQPRVRGMFMYKADANGLVFHTGAFKSLYRQLLQHKQVEACFNSPEKQIRVAGVADILEDENLKKEILEARPFLTALMGEQGNTALIIFRITGCTAAVWTMETNLEPLTIVQI